MDFVLFIIFLMTIAYTVYCIATNDMTPEERDEMLDSDEMWP
jgi:hypothetical protein